MTTSSGLLLVDKPGGVTSHDVVNLARRAIGEKRVGHAGTLDPMATGLLVLGVGPATRLLRFAQSGVKRYQGVVGLGTATDTLDADGVVVEERPVPELSIDDVAAVASGMLGAQSQVPPMVSAVKVGGERLYKLAREGVEVERAPREITVSAFAVAVGDTPDEWRFDVECSTGTYVRVLLSDLARALGTVGHLSALRRVASGRFRVEDAVTVESLAQAGASALKAPGEFVADLEAVVLGASEERRVRQGQRVVLEGAWRGTQVAAWNERGALVGVMARRGDEWQPEIVLPDEGDAAHRLSP